MDTEHSETWKILRYVLFSNYLPSRRHDASDGEFIAFAETAAGVDFYPEFEVPSTANLLGCLIPLDIFGSFHEGSDFARPSIQGASTVDRYIPVRKLPPVWRKNSHI